MQLKSIPSFPVVALGLFTVLLVLALILMPIGGWGKFILPRAYDRDQITQAALVPLLQHRDDGCMWGTVEAWQRARDAHLPFEWWLNVASAARHGAGWVLAAAGLEKADSARFRAILDSAASFEPKLDSVFMLSNVEERPLPLGRAEAIRLLRSGALTAKLDSARRRWPGCPL